MRKKLKKSGGSRWWTGSKLGIIGVNSIHVISEILRKKLLYMAEKSQQSKPVSTHACKHQTDT